MDKSFEEASAFKSISFRVLETLGQYEMTVGEQTIFKMLDMIAVKLIKDTNKERYEVVNLMAKQFEHISQIIADDILASLAEERPGTDPFSHEANILVPLIFVFTLINSLSLSVKIAIQNEEIDFALSLTETIGGLSYFMGQKTDQIMPLTNIDVSEIGKDGTSLLPGPSVLIPQSALAYISRLMTDIIAKLNLDRLKPNLEEGLVSVEVLATQFQRQLDLLVLLRARYGNSGNPSNLS